MRWREHTEIPEGNLPITALLAVKDEGGEPFLLNGIFNWRNGQWSDENNDMLVSRQNVFWWLPESELLAALTPNA